MSFTPLLAIVALLVIGAVVTLTILFRASQAGMFRNLKAGAYVIFDEDEPVGEPQDQLFKRDPASDDEASDGRAPTARPAGSASSDPAPRPSHPDENPDALDSERDGAP